MGVDSFTVELVSIASLQLFQNNMLGSFTIFLPEHVNLDGQWEVAISEFSYPSIYQNVTEGKFLLYDDKFSKISEANYFEPGLYSSITDIVEAMNTLIQEKNNQRDTCITINNN